MFMRIAIPTILLLSSLSCTRGVEGDTTRKQLSLQTVQSAQPVKHDRDAKVFDTAGVARVSFLIDGSGSMIAVFSGVREVVKSAVAGLAANQSFNVIAWLDDNAVSYSQNGLIPAGKAEVANIGDWLDGLSPREAFDAGAAFRRAFADKPDAIYLITDEIEGSERVANELLATVAELNAGRKVKIHCVLLTTDPARDATVIKALQTITRESGGTMTIAEKAYF
jgi:hypothetical protein